MKGASSTRLKALRRFLPRPRACKSTVPCTRTIRGTLTNKLTVNLGLRYELQGTWSDAYGRLVLLGSDGDQRHGYWLRGNRGSACPGDAFLVGTGRNTSSQQHTDG